MSDTLYLVLGTVMLCAITLATRMLPFLFAEQLKSSVAIQKLGNQLPAVIMLLLVLFTLRETPVLTYPYAIPEAIGLITVVALQAWMRNTILSIFVGMAVYLAIGALL